ncbi:MAG: hypothetical protein IIA49_03445 [Bacteroidetes bacterium]|nr:hypothetical protein [Bacteroidota bacterium]
MDIGSKIFSLILLSAFFTFTQENNCTTTETLNFKTTIVAFILNLYTIHCYLQVNCTYPGRGTSIVDEYKIKRVSNPVKFENKIFTVERQ